MECVDEALLVGFDPVARDRDSWGRIGAHSFSELLVVMSELSILDSRSLDFPLSAMISNLADRLKQCMYYLHEIIFGYIRDDIPRASKVLNIPKNDTAHLLMLKNGNKHDRD